MFQQDDPNPEQLAACKLIASISEEIEREFDKHSVPIDLRLSALSTCILHLLMNCEDSEKFPMLIAHSKALVGALAVTPKGTENAQANLYIQRQAKEESKEDNFFPDPASPLRH